jgi:flagellar basal-body rod protein FlgF
MNYGLYLSASGVLTSMYRQDVYANNLANVQTAGFKPDVATVRHRLPASQESSAGSPFRQLLLDKVGGGALAGPQSIDFTPGQIQPGGKLDAALTDKNQFFAVSTTDPKTGQQQVRLTRDGRFTVNAKNELVTMTNGHAVLGANDSPIVLTGTGEANILGDGRVMQDGQATGQVQVDTISDPSRLVKEGQGLFRMEGNANQRTAVTNPVLAAGHVEGSGVHEINELMDIMNAAKDVTNNGNLIRYHDSLMDKAVNTLGRVG